jgi:hypothetical protein
MCGKVLVKTEIQVIWSKKSGLVKPVSGLVKPEKNRFGQTLMRFRFDPIPK